MVGGLVNVVKYSSRCICADLDKFRDSPILKQHINYERFEFFILRAEKFADYSYKLQKYLPTSESDRKTI